LTSNLIDLKIDLIILFFLIKTLRNYNFLYTFTFIIVLESNSSW